MLKVQKNELKMSLGDFGVLFLFFQGGGGGGGTYFLKFQFWSDVLKFPKHVIKQDIKENLLMYSVHYEKPGTNIYFDTRSYSQHS